MDYKVSVEKLLAAAKNPACPYTAGFCLSAQALQTGNVIATTNGISVYDAVWRVLGMIRLLGHKERSGWAAVVCRCESDGSLSEPIPADEGELDVLRDYGLHMLMYVHADGSTHQQ